MSNPLPTANMKISELILAKHILRTQATDSRFYKDTIKLLAESEITISDLHELFPVQIIKESGNPKFWCNEFVGSDQIFLARKVRADSVELVDNNWFLLSDKYKGTIIGKDKLKLVAT